MDARTARRLADSLELLLTALAGRLDLDVEELRLLGVDVILQRWIADAASGHDDEITQRLIRSVSGVFESVDPGFEFEPTPVRRVR